MRSESSTNPYDKIAYFYDRFQDFDASNLAIDWAEFIYRIIEQFKMKQEALENSFDINKQSNFLIKERTLDVLDLGCGTAKISLALSRIAPAWRILGVDNSKEMLIEAANNQDMLNSESLIHSNKYSENLAAMNFFNSSNIEFSMQDIRELNLDKKFDCIYTSLDVFNHLNFDELRDTFLRIKEHLKPKALLIFDLHSLTYMEEILGGNVYSEIAEDYAVIWKNNFSLQYGKNQAAISSFLEIEKGIYRREDLLVNEYYHSVKNVLDLLANLGFNARRLKNDEFIDSWEGKRIFVEAYLEGAI